jgi:DNA-binding Lrp family transcriptional regulator
MQELDETDHRILQLLLSDARRPYSDIAEAVDLSPPAVSDRVTRLREAGVVRRFTVDVDRSQLHDGVPVLVRLSVAHGGPPVGDVVDALVDAGPVEHVFRTAEGDVVFHARPPDTDVDAWLGDVLDPDALGGVDVTLLSGVEWSPDLDGAAFALSCAECGNTVDSEGVAARVGGDRYWFCCRSCEEAFAETYDRIERDAD